MQPARCGETVVNSVENEPDVDVMSQHIAGRLAVPCAAAAVEDKVLMDSGSGITALSEELVEALHGRPRMTHPTLTLPLVGHAHVVTSLGQ